MKTLRIVAASPLLMLSQVLIVCGFIAMSAASRVANRNYTNGTYHAIAEIVRGGSEEQVKQRYNEAKS